VLSIDGFLLLHLISAVSFTFLEILLCGVNDALMLDSVLSMTNQLDAILKHTVLEDVYQRAPLAKKYRATIPSTLLQCIFFEFVLHAHK
jgi:hypothetical protein